MDKFPNEIIQNITLCLDDQYYKHWMYTSKTIYHNVLDVIQVYWKPPQDIHDIDKKIQKWTYNMALRAFKSISTDMYPPERHCGDLKNLFFVSRYFIERNDYGSTRFHPTLWKYNHGGIFMTEPATFKSIIGSLNLLLVRISLVDLIVPFCQNLFEETESGINSSVYSEKMFENIRYNLRYGDSMFLLSLDVECRDSIPRHLFQSFLNLCSKIFSVDIIFGVYNILCGKSIDDCKHVDISKIKHLTWDEKSFNYLINNLFCVGIIHANLSRSEKDSAYSNFASFFSHILHLYENSKELFMLLSKSKELYNIFHLFDHLVPMPSVVETILRNLPLFEGDKQLPSQHTLKNFIKHQRKWEYMGYVLHHKHEDPSKCRKLVSHWVIHYIRVGKFCENLDWKSKFENDSWQIQIVENSKNYTHGTENERDFFDQWDNIITPPTSKRQRIV